MRCAFHLIEAGQGRAVLRRRRPDWQRQLGWVFEEAARAHAVRLVQKGELPHDLVIGRWWSTRGVSIEIDVLGLQGSRTQLLGVARWQERPLGLRDAHALAAKAAFAPQVVDEPTIALWGRGGVAAETAQAGVLGYDIEDMLAA